MYVLFVIGYYYKIASTVDQWFIIPGYYHNNETEFAFIYIGSPYICYVYRYPYNSFRIYDDQYNISDGYHFSIDSNHFYHNKLILNIPNDTYLYEISPPKQSKNIPSSIKSNILFNNMTTGFPITLLQLGAMGYYGWIPFLECYHATMSMSFNINGNFNINSPQSSINLNFNDIFTRGYLEKDWGTNFPKTWIWIQSSNFDTLYNNKPISLTIALARLPLKLGNIIDTTVPGFLCGFLFNGKFYAFSKWNFSSVKKLKIIKYTDKETGIKMKNVSMVAQNLFNTQRLYVYGIIPDVDNNKSHSFPYLPQPTFNGFKMDLIENMNVFSGIIFEDDYNNIYYKGKSYPTTIEVHGGIQYLLDNFG